MKDVDVEKAELAEPRATAEWLEMKALLQGLSMAHATAGTRFAGAAEAVLLAVPSEVLLAKVKERRAARALHAESCREIDQVARVWMAKDLVSDQFDVAKMGAVAVRSALAVRRGSRASESRVGRPGVARRRRGR